MLQVEQLTKSFGDRVLFSDISFSIERGQKVGLIAPNGTGKSTLMRILLGREPQDSGTITYERDIKQAFLPQLPDLPETGTILEACFSPYDPVAQLTLAWEIAVEAGDSQTMERLLPEMEAKGAWHYEQRAKEILGALGIHDYQRSVKGLSGGEAKRIALGSTLISQPDLLFLDEPTNHLDLKSIEWLESYLARSTMGLLLITHDRYFLDRVCNQIIELDGGRLYRYKGNYDYYLAKREERHEQEEQSRQRALNLYRRELEWMRRQPQARGTKAQYRIDAFHELEAKTRPAQRTDEVQLGTSSTRIGKKIFEAHHVNKCFGDKVLLQDFNYVFSRYDKVGIIGENGVGKTTLAQIIAHRLETPFYTLSAVTSGVKDVRDVIERAQSGRFFNSVSPILFIDEIHRFSKSQQDSLLGAVEKGTVTLIGATTENPSFEVIRPLLSRCQLYVLKSLEKDDLLKLLHRAITEDVELHGTNKA